MADITLKATATYETLQPYKVELTRGQKGVYGWTITVHEGTPTRALNDLSFIDESLRTRYLEPTPETPTE